MHAHNHFSFWLLQEHCNLLHSEDTGAPIAPCFGDLRSHHSNARAGTRVTASILLFLGMVTYLLCLVPPETTTSIPLPVLATHPAA